MRRTRSLLALLWLAGVAVSSGCAGNSEAPVDDGFNDPTANGNDAGGGDPGAAAITRNGCSGCHDGTAGSLAGSDQPMPGTLAYGSNLTPDPDTGLGAWSDAQIIAAMRLGTNAAGAALCSAMPRYTAMSDSEAQAIVAALRALPAVNHRPPASQCTDGSGTGNDDAGTDVDAAAPSDDVPLTLTDDVPTADDVLDAGTWTAPDAGRVDAGRVDAGTRVDAGRDVPVPPPVDAGPIGCHPVINEVLTGAASHATYEWVEIFNPCTTTVSLTGWRLGYRSATNTSAISATDSSTLFAFAAQSLAPGGYLLVAGAGYTGTADGSFTSGMADAGGGVGLRNLAGTVVDSMGWGTATNAFVRGHAASVAPSVAIPGNSLQRLPDGADTQDGAADFHVSTHPTPRAANR